MRVKLSFFILFSFMVYSQNEQLIFWNNKNIEQAKEHFDEHGKARIDKWLKFIDESINETEWKKIHLVNTFLNQNIAYKTDIALWQKRDYWATPLETLGLGMGDCEDYAVAKYFTLIALGIPENKIRLMYVRQLNIDQPHMVLIYFEKFGETPFVLDNFNLKLVSADRRPDLSPIYSFNGNGLWLAKSKGLGNRIKNSQGVSAWTAMLKRIEQGQLAPKQ